MNKEDYLKNLFLEKKYSSLDLILIITVARILFEFLVGPFVSWVF